MSNYENKINGALEYLKKPSLLTPQGQKPIVFFVYDPKDALVVRKTYQAYIRNKAEYVGFKPVFVSFGKMLNDFISSNTEMIDIWRMLEASDENKLFRSIRQYVETEKIFEKEFLRLQEEHLGEPNTLFVFTDLEMMHPFYLMGTFEASIYNEIKLPILVLYPGDNQGTARSFLAVYNQDGNYRSVNY